MQNNEIPDSSAQHGERTSLLTEDDKRRIIAEIELRQELLRQVSSTNMSSAGETSNSLLAYLNSPFVVTVVGGVILALLGGLFQHHYAQIESDQAYVRTLRDKKYELLRSFAADLDLKHRYMAWLSGNYHYLYTSSKDAYGQQVVRSYPDVFQLYLKTPQSVSYAAQINAAFNSPVITEKVKTLIDVESTALQEAAIVAQSPAPTSRKPGQPIGDPESDYYKSVSDKISPPREDLFRAMEENIKNTRADSL
jgi:hypothetical protein